MGGTEHKMKTLEENLLEFDPDGQNTNLRCNFHIFIEKHDFPTSFQLVLKIVKHITKSNIKIIDIYCCNMINVKYLEV